MRDPLAPAKKVATKSSAGIASDSAVLSLLAELVAEVRGLRADLVASRRPIQISMGDAELLRAIAATSQGQTFSVDDLLLRAGIVDQRAGINDCGPRSSPHSARSMENGWPALATHRGRRC